MALRSNSSPASMSPWLSHVPCSSHEYDSWYPKCTLSRGDPDMGESICDSGMQGALCRSRGASWKEKAEGTQLTGVNGPPCGPDASDAIDDAGEIIWLLPCSMDMSREI